MVEVALLRIASEVLLPHITASVARALKCEIVQRGVCTVNGELRDANALDLARADSQLAEKPSKREFGSISVALMMLRARKETIPSTTHLLCRKKTLLPTGL
jgi:hypothetical protein